MGVKLRCVDVNREGRRQFILDNRYLSTFQRGGLQGGITNFIGEIQGVLCDCTALCLKLRMINKNKEYLRI